MADIDALARTVDDAARNARAIAQLSSATKFSLDEAYQIQKKMIGLRIARGDETALEGFEQDGYIENSHANERSFSDLLCEFGELRAANLRLMRSMDEADWRRMGTASGFPVSARALAFIMAGHVRHHLNIVIERYLA